LLDGAERGLGGITLIEHRANADEVPRQQLTDAFDQMVAKRSEHLSTPILRLLGG
jgi:hypothetical protein